MYKYASHQFSQRQGRRIVNSPARSDGVGSALRAAYRRSIDELPAEFRDILDALDKLPFNGRG